ncbi:hypothetical protein FB451DRAFT_1273588 [Mycena latifolia]|nr:hypothetical protein FB451DRAFT_1273588 [Mycena latifolia]
MESERCEPPSPTLVANRLPLDFERAIFESCALSRPVTIPNLMLVAWRVKDWLEPLLYRVICVSDSLPRDGFPHFTLDILQSAINRKPASFFHHAVRHLYLEDPCDAAQLCTILAACTGVTDLFAEVPGAASAAPAFGALPLRHLAAIIGGLDFTHALFRHITHLTMLELGGPAAGWEGLADLPHLTHVAYANPNFAHTLAPILLRCPHLRALHPARAQWLRVAADRRALRLDEPTRPPRRLARRRAYGGRLLDARGRAHCSKEGGRGCPAIFGVHLGPSHGPCKRCV